MPLDEIDQKILVKKGKLKRYRDRIKQEKKKQDMKKENSTNKLVENVRE